jgi:hypothetical protein
MKSRTTKTKKNPDTELSRKRRTLLKGLAGLPLMAGFGNTLIKDIIIKSPEYDGITGLEYPGLSEVKGDLPQGKIGDLNISRLIMGCNPIGGWAHARDLNYAYNLFRAYNTEQKVIETLHLSEQAGINTAFMVNGYYPVFHKFLKESSGKMQSICQTYLLDDNFLGDIDKAADNGATALYIQGAYGDRYVREGKTGLLAKAIEHIKKKGYLAGKKKNYL